ncbi:hypothetical protein chiPu_0022936 [Chiloscyllium punctatum]|uniref:Uncharacterized protein n=1 Tax=Chiloscyllium punctatum TaxID=137246 RepID=A0A401T9C5_CHIPU|nr:hypothetical protein [Chiloscyllium punctatum]
MAVSCAKIYLREAFSCITPMFSIWNRGNGPDPGVTTGIRRTIPTPVASLTSQSGITGYTLQGMAIKRPGASCLSPQDTAASEFGHNDLCGAQRLGFDRILSVRGVYRAEYPLGRGTDKAVVLLACGPDLWDQLADCSKGALSGPVPGDRDAGRKCSDRSSGDPSTLKGAFMGFVEYP